MSDREEIRKQLLQRLDGLRRAGLDRVPQPPARTVTRERVEVVESPTPPKARDPLPRPRAATVAKPAPALALPASLYGEPGLSGPEVPAAERPSRLASLAEVVSACVRCPMLAAHRTQTVFGEGSATARLMFIGEGPGAEEDRTGRPFVGKAGTLLTDMITKGMGLAREDVYIANIVKSRPPDNRNPEPDEIAHCLPYLEEQIAIIRPAYLCLLGKVAASTLLQTALPMNRLRGRWHSYRGIPAIATWHPAYLLRTPTAKKEAWDDLQMLMKRMGIKPPERGKKAE